MLSRAIETLGRRAGIILARKNAGIAILARLPILRRLSPIEWDARDRVRLALNRPAIRLPACGFEQKLRPQCEWLEFNWALGIEAQPQPSTGWPRSSSRPSGGRGAITGKRMAFDEVHPGCASPHVWDTHCRNTQPARVNRQ
jgi:hypothetical protein